MKLNKDTRDEVRIGTILSHGVVRMQVVRVRQSGMYGQGKSITVRVISWYDDAKWLVGRVLPSEPLSHFYGDDIDNSFEIKAGDTFWNRYDREYIDVILTTGENSFLCRTHPAGEGDAPAGARTYTLEDLVHYEKV